MVLGSALCAAQVGPFWPGTNLQQVNPDFKELLLAFNAHNVEYLIVGAHALAAHGHVRATKEPGSLGAYLREFERSKGITSAFRLRCTFGRSNG